MSASLEDFDLNLLRHLAVLLDARSVSAAAETLGLSQPTLSRSLGTLRLMFGDPLLVRSGRSMIPTPRALELQAELEPLVERLTEERILFDIEDDEGGGVSQVRVLRGASAVYRNGRLDSLQAT